MSNPTGSYGIYDHSSFHHGPDHGGIQLGPSLAPLLFHLQSYDNLRLRLENEGGTLADLRELTEVLSSKVVLDGRYGKREISLVDQKSLTVAIDDISYEINFQVRRLPGTNFPVYYLCRTHRDSWGMHSLVVEDFYRSPGYPVSDDRFVQLMGYDGKERFELRLSSFRQEVSRRLFQNGQSGSGFQIDRILYQVGRHVFQAAWHEDQRLGVLAGEKLKIPALRQAIEVLYLCLSGDLCELRDEMNQDDAPILKFFEEVYPQPAIHGFLLMLQHLEGQALSDLPSKALGLYKKLSMAFKDFMNERSWERDGVPVPTFKVLLANFCRLDLVKKDLLSQPSFIEASAILDGIARGVIDELVRDNQARR